MAYTPDNHIFVSQVQQALARTEGRRPVWAGIGAYRLDLNGIVEKVELARRAGAGGVVLFSHESLAPSDWPRLRQEVFATPLKSAGSSRPAAAGPLPSR
jgi:hypothetical protein